MSCVIVGNGVAGIEAARALRRRDPAAEIVLVSEESDHFFARTGLLWALSGQLRVADLEPYERDLYARERFVRVRARAVGLDLDGRRLRLAGGLPPLSWDRLLLACGSRARPAPWPGAELRGVGSFVTLSDLAWLEEELFGGPGRGGGPPRPDAHHALSAPGSPYLPRASARARRGRAPRAVGVVGGGLIGLEGVEAMLAAGHRPHLFLREEGVWPLTLDRRERAWLEEALRAHGVQVHPGARLRALHGEAGCLREVELEGGARVPMELLLVAIGVEPNTGWLRESGIALDPEFGGIRVDAGLRASHPGVWAAGDCAAVPGPDGRARPLTLWYTARDQGRIAGAALAGEDVAYPRGLPYNAARLLDIDYTSVGEVEPGPGLRSLRVEERGPVRSSTRICLREGRVVGFSLLGRRWDHTVLARFIEEGRPLPRLLPELGRARFDGEAVPPLRLPLDVRGWIEDEP